MRGGDLQAENGPELAFRGAARRLGAEAGGDHALLENQLGRVEPGCGERLDWDLTDGWWSLPQQG